MQGILVLDKPPGISSARAVARVKRLLPRGTKIGHAGTLDPFATGILLLLIGKATKLCEKLMDSPKQYEARIKFGANTATDDPESPEQPHVIAKIPDVLRIDEALQAFVGRIEQRPPIYSAMKVGGQRAYKLARKGEAVEMKPRTVVVYGIERLDYAWPELSLRIDCGRGTYIRSIARDLGEALSVGGYLTALRRTRVGRFELKNAASIEQLTEGTLESMLQCGDEPLTR